MSNVTLRLGAGVRLVALLALCSTTSYAQFNPSGWIQRPAWNMLLPLVQNGGCGGGGNASMARNYVAPHNIGREDPRAGDVWDGSGPGFEKIDFEVTAASLGFGAGALLNAF